MTVLSRSKKWLPAAAVLLFSMACAFFGRGKPDIQNHPAPNMPAAPPLEAFDDAACPLENGMQACPPESELGALGCEQVRAAGSLLAGLSPAVPLRVCLSGASAGQSALFREGCRAALDVRYVIQDDGGFRVIASAADLAEAFAPIENEIEALSFALAATGLGVRYDLAPETGLRYFAGGLQDTFVRRVERGFIVHLFDYQLCGCGPHSTSTVDLLVSFDGQIEELQREKVFEDPAEDELCVD